MTSPELTVGSLATILRGGKVDKPVMQILGTKKLGDGPTTPSSRYRILLSDGRHSNSYVMLGTQINGMIETGELSEFTIVQINNVITSIVGGGQKRVMIVLDLSVLVPGSEVGVKIGNPSIYVDGQNATPTLSSHPIQQGNPQGSHLRQTSTSRPQQNNAPLPFPITGSPGMSASECRQTHSIVSLSPYQNRWVIKVRVTMKTPIKTWANARGEGKLFSMDLVDESGEIRATAFKDQCDKFFDVIEAGKVYYISRATLKTANKKFTSIKNDYEMSFTSETEVIPCLDDADDVPTLTFNFLPIDQIVVQEATAIVDVIGICKSVDDLKTLFTKTTNREITKREVMLVDTSNTAVSLTLWGTQAEEFDGSMSPVVAIKGARLNDYGGGRSVSTLQSSVIQVNPDIPEAHQLRGWFDNGGAVQESNSISTKAFGGGGGALITIGEARLKQLGCGNTADYFTCKATVVFIRSERPVYQACPTDSCNKKVVDQGNNMYRCEKCNCEYPNFKYRLLLQMSLADYSGSQWVSGFQELGEQLLGTTAQEVGEASAEEGDKNKLQTIFNKASFKTYTFQLRAKMDSYNDEHRLKITAVEAKPINFVEHSKYLLGEIKKRVPALQNKI